MFQFPRTLSLYCNEGARKKSIYTTLCNGQEQVSGVFFVYLAWVSLSKSVETNICYSPETKCYDEVKFGLKTLKE